MSFFLYLLFFVYISSPPFNSFFFFFNDTATTEIYTLSLHDALPIWYTSACCRGLRFCCDSSQSCNPRQRAAVNHPLRSRGSAISKVSVSRDGPSNSTGYLRGSLVSKRSLDLLPMNRGRRRSKFPAGFA